MGDADDSINDTTHVNLGFRGEEDEGIKTNNNSKNDQNNDVIKIDENDVEQNSNKIIKTETESAEPEVENKSHSVIRISDDPIIISDDDAIQEVKENGDALKSNLENEHVIDIDNFVCTEARRPSTPGKKSRTLSSKKAENLDDLRWYEWITCEFKRIAGKKGHITLKDFKDALQIKKSFLAERFFEIFDEDQSGSIELIELMSGLRLITKGTPEEKLNFLFKVYDVDGSGSIDREELKTVLTSCMEESSLTLGEENVDKMTEALFESADANKDGLITFEELKDELSKHHGAIDNLTIGAASWLKPKSGNARKTKMRYFSYIYLRNNFRKAIFLLLYILLNVALAIYAGLKYRLYNGWVIVARICGMNLNFNGMFILILMLRKSLTYIRMTRARKYLPLDQNIFFHKMVGVVIAVYSLVHTFAHVGNAVVVSQSSKDVINATSTIEVWEILLTTKAGVGWVGSSAYVTGWLLDIILIVMVVCSMAWVRRSGRFQVFYWTHTLYVVFWLLLILHGPSFWIWFIIPGVLFLGEKFFRSKLVKRVRYGKNYIEKVTLLPSGVTHLQITSSDKFRFKPGDYIFIQIPVIAQYEWHPFTISSAPEMKGKFWLHVRSAGHWTKQLYQYFEELDPGEGDVSEDDFDDDILNTPRTRPRRNGLNRKDTYKTRDENVQNRHSDKEAAADKRKRRKQKKVKITCSIDGPYGTGCREVLDTEHAVLIGAGIGVTPMASILQSVMYRYKASKRVCPKCQNRFYGQIPDHSMKLKKVDFIWINRDQKSFEWFVSLLTQLELQQAELESDQSGLGRIIDIQLFMTAMKSKDDIRGLGLQLAFDLMRQKVDKDLVTGLKTQTQAGRPNWNKLFTDLSKQKKGKIKVFFCGAPALGKIIKTECEKFHFAFSKENF